MQLGHSMGLAKPAVWLSWVTQVRVRVRYLDLTPARKLRTCTHSLRFMMGMRPTQVSHRFLTFRTDDENASRSHSHNDHHDNDDDDDNHDNMHHLDRWVGTSLDQPESGAPTLWLRMCVFLDSHSTLANEPTMASSTRRTTTLVVVCGRMAHRSTIGDARRTVEEDDPDETRRVLCSSRLRPRDWDER